MKKIIALSVILTLVLSLCFATATSNRVNEGATTQLELGLNQDDYYFGFASDTSETPLDGNFALRSTIKENKTVSLISGTFYFFYYAITDDPNVNCTLTFTTPLYLDGDTSHGEDKMINYSATLNSNLGKWDGESLSNIVLTPKTNAPATVTFDVRNSSKKYRSQGLCSITITSDDDLGTKNYGSYHSTVVLTVTNQ